MTQRLRFTDKSARALDNSNEDEQLSPNDRLQAAIDCRLGKERTTDKSLNPNTRLQAAINARLGAK